MASFIAFTRVFPDPIDDREGPADMRLLLRDPISRAAAWLSVPYAGLLYFTYARYGSDYGAMLVREYNPGARAAVGLITLGFLVAATVGVWSIWRSYGRAAVEGRGRIIESSPRDAPPVPR